MIELNDAGKAGFLAGLRPGDVAFYWTSGARVLVIAVTLLKDEKGNESKQTMLIERLVTGDIGYFLLKSLPTHDRSTIAWVVPNDFRISPDFGSAMPSFSQDMYSEGIFLNTEGVLQLPVFYNRGGMMAPLGWLNLKTFGLDPSGTDSSEPLIRFPRWKIGPKSAEAIPGVVEFEEKND